MFLGLSNQIEPLRDHTRDTLLAITQTFLRKALEVHRADSPAGNKERNLDKAFIILPPLNVLQYFFEAYVCRFEPYCTFPNELMQRGSARVSSLVVLLMIAQGAMTTPTIEARNLTSGLIEVRRISLFDAIEKDTEFLRRVFRNPPPPPPGPPNAKALTEVAGGVGGVKK